ncbi:MAG: cytochrome c, class I [Alphaproteobacteria bacterium]|nr:MAG: cytochrome c, class I [Alphaproteobacteria bacterium]
MPGRVPPLKDHVARFLLLPEGRAFLVQVPGVARSALPDDRIAALLNWLVLHFDPDHVPNNFKPYTSDEVGRLRRNPRAEVAAYRRDLLERIAAIEKKDGRPE